MDGRTVTLAPPKCGTETFTRLPASSYSVLPIKAGRERLKPVTLILCVCVSTPARCLEAVLTKCLLKGNHQNAAAIGSRID